MLKLSYLILLSFFLIITTSGYTQVRSYISIINNNSEENFEPDNYFSLKTSEYKYYKSFEYNILPIISYMDNSQISVYADELLSTDNYQKISSKNDLIKTFQKISSKNEKSQLIILNGHGSNSEDNTPTSPSATGLLIKNELLKYSEIEKIFKKHNSTNKYVRFISVACYGGGVHELAFKFDNMCALTGTSWSMPYFYEYNHTNIFGAYTKMVPNTAGNISLLKRFSEQVVKNDFKKSIIETYMESLSNEFNYSITTSSFAFVEKIMDKNYDKIISDAESYDDPISKILYNDQIDKDETPFETLLSQEEENLLPEFLGRLYKETFKVDNFLKLGYKWGDLQKFNVATKKAMNSFEQIDKNFEKEFNKKKFIEISNSYSCSESYLGDILVQNQSQHPLFEVAQRTKKYLEDSEKSEQDYYKYIISKYQYGNFVKKLKMVVRFIQIASAEQLSKYLALLDCETKEL